MKSKIFLALSLCLGMAFTACDDDDNYIVDTTPIMNESSVVTGSADVTATTATLHGTVDGLKNSNSQSYVVGFNYGTDANALTGSVNGAFEEGTNNISATVTGLTEGTVIYYQTFAKLQGKVTFTGEVKSLVTTDAVVTTKDAAEVTAISATLGGSVTGAPADAAYGIVLAATSDVEAVREGLKIPAEGADFSALAKGLCGGLNYYYAAFADLGSGIVYGEVKNFITPVFDFDVNNDLVDLGLSVKWAKFNVGATSETELGGLFGFGDTSGTLTSTITSNYASADIYSTANDVAATAYGFKLTLPTAEQFAELFNNCTKAWEEVDGVGGYRFTGPNGNSIFLPAAGSRTINDVTEAGVQGYYATGSLATDKFAVAYNFSNGNSTKISVPVYQAVSARAVSTAVSVPFKKELLYKTWEIDYVDGKSIRFAGPVHFYGTDDSWATVTNHEPLPTGSDSWSWEADAGQSWAFGDCAGSLTLREDGTLTVVGQDGNAVDGTYTIDEAAKTITSTVDLLHPAAMSGYADYKTAIKILSLEDEKFQLGFFRDSDPATVSVNMVPASKKYGIAVNLISASADFSGNWGAEIGSILPDDLDGKHTLTYDGTMNGASVFLIDISEFAAKYPDGIATVTDIRFDGESVSFDASKMFYGDIENNGNYRIEFFNCYGSTNNDSPFGTASVGFSQNLEIDLVISTTNTFVPRIACVQKDWAAQVWDYNDGTEFKVAVNGGKLQLAGNAAMDMTMNASYPEPMMLFVQTDNFYQLFPAAKMTLTDVITDGTAVTGWDPAKVINCSADGGGVHHRLELFNCYGATANDCAFGTKQGDTMPTLGFNNSLELKFTVDGLF